MVSVFLLVMLVTATMAFTVKRPAANHVDALQIFNEGCSLVSESYLSNYVLKRDGNITATAVVIHPNIALATDKRLLTEESNIRVGAEWRPVEDVKSAKNMHFIALLWEKPLTKTSIICAAEDGDQLSDCHAEFSRKDGWIEYWDKITIIRSEMSTRIISKNCIPDNSAIFCKGPDQYQVFVGFAINCNQRKSELVGVLDALMWLQTVKLPNYTTF